MNVDAPIVAVTVYPDRARVTRRGAVTLQTGAHELCIPGLTQLLDPQSVRAGGQGAARVRLLGVDVRETYYVETPSERAAELEAQIQSLQDADLALEDEDKLLKNQLEFLKNMTANAGKSLANGIGRGRAKVADGSEMLNFVSAQYGQFAGRRREIGIERRKLAQEIDVLQQELGHIQGARPRQRYEALIGIEALSEGDFEFELEYTTRGGASWQPLYDLRLLTGADEPQVELTYLGEVRQSTGEDWRDVDLTLSTARPSVSATIPDLSPWYVDVFRPQPPPAPKMLARRAAMPPTMSAGALAPDMAMPVELERAAPVAAEAAQASVDTSGAAVAFHIPRRVDIPADNTPHKTTVLLIHLAPRLDFVAVPKLSDEVYRRATIKNDTEVTLLPGEVTLFHGGEFVGRATLSKIAPQQEFETTLGIDDRIKVEREMVLNEVGKQFIGDRRVHRYAYEIEVQNWQPHPATVVVQDQLPVSANEEIKIKDEGAAPEPTQRSEQQELEWTLALEPGQKQKIRFEFTVAAPRSRMLTGLPQH